MKTTLIKRIKAYLIDFCFLFIAFFVFSLLFNSTDLNDKINTLNSDYILGNINFNDYITNTGEIYRENDKDNIIINVLNIFYITLYFIIFPYYHNGQTIGKKILNIKVKSMGNQKVSLKQLFLRSLIITGLFYLIFTLVALILPFNYFVLISIFGFIQIILIIICMLMAFFRKDKRGLHDLISETRVLNTKWGA